MLTSAKSCFFHAANITFEYAKENPGAAAAMGVAGIMVVAPVVVAAPAIAAAGFGANGIAAGSAAAGMHAGIGNIVAHSGFATLQSYGMAGYGVPIVHGAVQAVGAAVGAGTAYSQRDEKKSSDGGSKSKGDKGAKEL